MRLDVGNLLERAGLALLMFGPGLLLVNATQSGLAFLVGLMLQYTAGTIGGLLLYKHRSPTENDRGSNRHSGPNSGQAAPFQKAA
ncbi:MAG TPA: hypothetical protein VJ464_19100 [Blastocatellia bacterium]|nr:hypothetical protein [Blastocatellia bacterium]